MTEQVDDQTWQEKLLFYTTAFFILLATFSLFAFLFLVPFVIDPAFTTIFMEFDETSALCRTVEVINRKGASNCSWSSCREGCTKEVYGCTQIYVDYWRGLGHESNEIWIPPTDPPEYKPYQPIERNKRGIRDYDDYAVDSDSFDSENPGDDMHNGFMPNGFADIIAEEDTVPTDAPGNESDVYYRAKLFPNVKGCGYPPSLNCTIFTKRYHVIGKNFTCYYSKVDPGIVISELDMWQVYMNLVYAMAIPIPSFIFSVIYLTIAYFKIYNEDEDTELLEDNAEEMNEDIAEEDGTEIPKSATNQGLQQSSELLTPGSEAFREDLASFGHQYKVAMADELSRESFAVPISNSISIPGNLSKTMMTSISTPAGDISDL